MSRIGKMPVQIPAGVEVKQSGRMISAKGPLGKAELEVHPEMTVKVAEGRIDVSRPSDGNAHRALHGLTRQLIRNMVLGVSQGFEKQLEIIGVGYKAQVQGKTLKLSLGFSHDVDYAIPSGLSVSVEANTKISVKGIDKAEVGQTAAEIRGFRPPEPYKGKGIRYVGEYVRRKAGKVGVA